ncbi:glycosyltransferase family 1 protein [Pontiellaceae bacterium B1224]|nr:glycosyltransferase family 1 protein [Pontiellaceae bacterium B1224]
MIDQMLVSHAELFHSVNHKILVSGRLYDGAYKNLSDFWKMESFIPYTSSQLLQQARWVWRNAPKAEKYWDDVDIVYCPAESYVPTGKAKLVCTIHDVAGYEKELYPNSWARTWHCRKWRLLFQKIELHADAVVTVSDFSAERIGHFFPGLRSKLHVIHNAPHRVFGATVSEADAAQAIEITGGAPFILVPGGLSLRKNAELVLQALRPLAKACPNIRIIITGRNNSNYTERLKKVQNNSIVLAGYVSDHLLNALYQQAEVVWFPSRYEGFGMPVVEAMAAGTPVVASNTASIPEVAGDAAVLCGVNAAEEHVEAIQMLLENSGKRRELRDLGKQRSARFTWEASARKLNELFESFFV